MKKQLTDDSVFQQPADSSMLALAALIIARVVSPEIFLPRKAKLQAECLSAFKQLFLQAQDPFSRYQQLCLQLLENQPGSFMKQLNIARTWKALEFVISKAERRCGGAAATKLYALALADAVIEKLEDAAGYEDAYWNNWFRTHNGHVAYLVYASCIRLAENFLTQKKSK